jgi:putative chitinase
MISTTQIRLGMPYATPENIDRFAQALNDTCAEFGITTPQRQSVFLAQLTVESGSLKYVRELADGRAYEPALPGQARNPIAEQLGNMQPGDGSRFRGRGLGQLTGRRNYTVCGIALGVDLIANPEKLEEPVLAARSAGWFWQTHGLAAPADGAKFWTCCKLWNGGTNGLDDRIVAYLNWRKALEI